MNCWEFLASIPIITIILIFVVASMVKRYMKFTIINTKGYPPPHCDANGNFKEDKVTSPTGKTSF